jgi:hypothetical protein
MLMILNLMESRLFVGAFPSLRGACATRREVDVQRAVSRVARKAGKESAMTVRLSAVLIASLVLPGAAEASSDAAWAALHAKVGQRCRAASGLAAPRSAAPVGFDDKLGKMVTLVTGSERLARGRSVRTAKLCVYDQRSGRTWVSEAKGWQVDAR